MFPPPFIMQTIFKKGLHTSLFDDFRFILNVYQNPPDETIRGVSVLYVIMYLYPLLKWK